MNTAIQEIAAVLAFLGWNTDELAPWGYAIKTYPTAVGLKDAHAYLRFRKDLPLATLSGTYWSEGRNALCSCWQDIHRDQVTKLAQAVQRFASEVDRCVADTYAVRLLRHSVS